MEHKDVKLIFNPGLSRKLLHMGCTIVDIKPDRNNPDKTIFCFKRDEIFDNAMNLMLANTHEAEPEE